MFPFNSSLFLVAQLLMGKQLAASHFSLLSVSAMEWSNAVVLSFIEDYRNNPSLWDNKLPDYKNMALKKNVMQELADKYACDVDLIKRKIKSLRTAFRREVTKIRNRRRFEGADTTSRWFAYRPLSFLMDDESLKLETDGEVDEELEVEETQDYALHDYQEDGKKQQHMQLQIQHQQQHILQVQQHQIVQPQQQKQKRQNSQEQQDNDLYQNGYLESTESHHIPDGSPYITHVSSGDRPAPNASGPRRPARIKRPFRDIISPSSVERNMIEACKLFRPSTTCSTPKDEFDFFGKNIAARIRKLKTEKAKSCVQHLVSNIIFEAEMGKYDDGLPSSSMNSQGYSSSSSQPPDISVDQPYIKLEM